jgi:FMN phosphatase YigB (HAD superfamily)
MRYIFVDFDDTLYEHRLAKEDPVRMDIDPVLMEQGTAFYEKNGCLNQGLQKFCRDHVSQGDRIIVLTSSNNSIETKCKKHYLAKNFAVEHVLYAVANGHSKAKFIVDFCEAKKIESKDVLVIDDDVDTRKGCKHNNIRAISPEETE